MYLKSDSSAFSSTGGWTLAQWCVIKGKSSSSSDGHSELTEIVDVDTRDVELVSVGLDLNRAHKANDASSCWWNDWCDYLRFFLTSYSFDLMNESVTDGPIDWQTDGQMDSLVDMLGGF